MVKKNEMEKYLNSFPWKFREIFIESSFWARIQFLNWKIKTPVISRDNWFSILSRNWKEEFFKVISWENYDFNSEIRDFVSENSLSMNINKISLNWEESLSHEHTDFSEKLKEITEITSRIYTEVFSWNELIKSSQISINLSSKNFIVWNSKWNFAKDELFYNTFYIVVIWEKNWEIEEAMDKMTWIDILNDFTEEKIRETFLSALRNLEIQFKAKKSPNWEMFVLVWNEAGWTIIHEAVGHWLEWDLQWSSVYSWKIWEKVADESVTIIDNPTFENERGFYKFDHEWNEARKVVLIENWILKTYLHTEKTWEKFGVESTWHARREDYNYRTLVRMWITYLAPGKDKKEDLIKKVDSWIYVSRMWGGQVDTVTWDFVFEVKYGFKIEKWEIVWEIKWATISWNWPEMLNKVYWICDDMKFFDGGTCGKWQSMPVSDANPTFLTKLKVTWI